MLDYEEIQATLENAWSAVSENPHTSYSAEAVHDAESIIDKGRKTPVFRSDLYSRALFRLKLAWTYIKTESLVSSHVAQSMLSQSARDILELRIQLRIKSGSKKICVTCKKIADKDLCTECGSPCLTIILPSNISL